MAYDNPNQQPAQGGSNISQGGNQYGDRQNQESLYTRRIKAGKRRTYFFDVRATRGNDYFVTLTESKKRFEDGGYERHKIFLYKEDFNKFLAALADTINFVKTDLMPDFDFDAFNHDYDEERNYQGGNHTAANVNAVAILPEAVPAAEHVTTAPTPTLVPAADLLDAEVDSWKA